MIDKMFREQIREWKRESYGGEKIYLLSLQY